MKTIAEFRAELYDKAKSDLKTKRLIIELIAGIPVAVALGSWMFYSKLEIFFVFNYSPLFVLVLLWLYLGWNQKTFTKIASSKIEKKFGELLISTEKECISFIKNREADIQSAMEDIKLYQHDLELLKAIIGQKEIKTIEHLIDCDASPFIPNGWSVEEHKKGGMLKFNPEKNSLYLSKKQEKGSIKGCDLRKELANQPVLSAIVLDYLLAHPELIPEEWKGKAVLFWGTIYRDFDGDLCVRYLFWNGSQWGWYCTWLHLDFYSDDPAALAS